MPIPEIDRRRRTMWAAVGAIFLFGLATRLVIVSRAHREGDEVVYRALVENLEAGRGYTLRGHPLLEQEFIVQETYGRPLFFHPPGGPGLFWLMHRVFGDAGFSIAQLLSYGIFYWAMMGLAAVMFEPISPLRALLTALLAAFTPIMVHVGTRFWLDGPLLAFSTAAAAVFLLSHRRNKASGACVAGLLLGYACLIKPTALFVVPGLLALGWTIRATGRELVLRGVCLVGVALCLLAPWEIYQWSVIGNPLAVSPGRPVERLLATNAFVHYVTIVRSPWIYLSLLPRVLGTLVPALALLALQWRDAAVRRTGLALAGWIATPVIVQIGLGYVGYSKLLRYVILVTPATVLLFTLVTAAAWDGLRAGAIANGRRGLTGALLVAALAGLLLEVAQGIKTAFIDPAPLALILPLIGRP